MTTVKQDKDFLDSVIPSTLLDAAIDWINSNMSPDDVFSMKDLDDWAENNGYELKGEM